MPHVFISYAKKDTRPLALALRDALRRVAGLTAWMDESLEAGQSWALQIQAEIDRADCVVVLLSPDVNRPEAGQQRRSFVLNEIDYAQLENKPILPVMVVQTRTPIQLAGVQHIDLTKTPTDPTPVLHTLFALFGLSAASPAAAPKPAPSAPAFALSGFQTPVVTDAVTQAMTRAVLFNGKRNSDWLPVITTFSHLNLSDMRFCLVPSKRAKNSQPILNPFWISQRPVTLSQWNTAVIAGQVPFPSANPSSVVMMPEEDKAKFISWLGCRLPTQEELKFTLYGVDVNVSSPNWVGLDTTTDGLRVVLTEETYLNRPK
jgi:hypothetical protein